MKRITAIEKKGNKKKKTYNSETENEERTARGYVYFLFF